ncbi:hypothetical protein DZF91_11105 [Actinomadura logoneensis]|uniref:Uncharacterized protein n=1 Tax=Actinomadura logoneensis TaxID=2293572 RepID=A0A372JPA6_9ACTN|nr:hypothetical protein DZF91_11105 [Actinomadura logoneensis]
MWRAASFPQEAPVNPQVRPYKRLTRPSRPQAGARPSVPQAGARLSCPQAGARPSRVGGQAPARSAPTRSRPSRSWTSSA